MLPLTRFERARIIGARALQISMGAPILLDDAVGVVDPMTISMREFERGHIPIHSVSVVAMLRRVVS